MILTALLTFGIIFALALGGTLYFVLVRGVAAQIGGSIFFGLIGVGLLGLGSAFAWNNSRFLRRAASASGEIVSVDKFMAQDEERKIADFYAPKVRFTTSHAKVIEFTGPTSRLRDYVQGERIEVLYLPEQPGSARIKELSQGWLLPAGLWVMGSVFSGIAWRIFRHKGSVEKASSLRLVSSFRAKPRVVTPPSA